MSFVSSNVTTFDQSNRNSFLFTIFAHLFDVKSMQYKCSQRNQLKWPFCRIRLGLFSSLSMFSLAKLHR